MMFFLKDAQKNMFSMSAPKTRRGRKCTKRIHPKTLHFKIHFKTVPSPNVEGFADFAEISDFVINKISYGPDGLYLTWHCAG